jgi:hypothetical protein
MGAVLDLSGRNLGARLPASGLPGAHARLARDALSASNQQQASSAMARVVVEAVQPG